MPKMTLATLIVLASALITSVCVSWREGMGLLVLSLLYIILCLAALVSRPIRDARIWVLVASIVFGLGGALMDILTDDPLACIVTLISQGIVSVLTLVVVMVAVRWKRSSEKREC